MEYLRVLWRHEHENEPVEIYSEIDDSRNETRKVERLQDGTLSYASTQNATGSSLLSVEPLPSTADIASNPEFEPSVIDRGLFETVWKEALAIAHR